jgi:hypothetical protein
LVITKANVFQYCHVQRQIQGLQEGHGLQVNGPASGREPEHFILAVGQLGGHQFTLAPGFDQVGKADFLAPAAIVMDQSELRMGLVGNPIAASVDFQDDTATLDLNGLSAREGNFLGNCRFYARNCP